MERGVPNRFLAGQDPARVKLEEDQGRPEGQEEGVEAELLVPADGPRLALDGNAVQTQEGDPGQHDEPEEHPLRRGTERLDGAVLDGEPADRDRRERVPEGVE